MQAAVGLAQLTKLDRVIERKRQIHNRYVEELGDIKEIIFCPIRSETTKPVFWFTSMLTENREALQNHLSSKQIGSRLFFYPMNAQPCYKHMNLDSENYKYSKYIYDRAISLPSSYQLSDQEQDLVINTIRSFYGK